MDLDFEYRHLQTPLIRLLWQTQSERAGGFISQADAGWEMVVTKYLGQTFISMRGPETKASYAEYPEGAEFFGIQFNLGVFMPHLPLNSIMDRNDDLLPLACHQSFWLNGETWEIPTFDNVDTFIRRLIRKGMLVQDDAVIAMLRGHNPYLSPRSLQRRFLRATGLPYKTILQIQRAQQAAELLTAHRPILDVVHELGYVDQSHLTNALRRFIGKTPAQFTLPLFAAKAKTQMDGLYSNRPFEVR